MQSPETAETIGEALGGEIRPATVRDIHKATMEYIALVDEAVKISDIKARAKPPYLIEALELSLQYNMFLASNKLVEIKKIIDSRKEDDAP